MPPQRPAPKVVVVGAGPVGLALAGDLAGRGVSCMLLEQGTGDIYQPRMDAVSIRTMEFCRRWGIADEVKACPYPQEYPQDIVYVTSLNGYELGREPFLHQSTGAEETALSYSPEVRVRCPQNMFDPVLRRFVASFEIAELKYRSKYLGSVQDDQRVRVRYEDLATGEERSIEADYLVGCDGGTSAVRQALGVESDGMGVLTYTTNVIIRSDDLFKFHDKAIGYRYIFFGTEGVWGTMVAINGVDEWRFSIIGSATKQDVDERMIAATLERMVGRSFEYEVVSTLPWVRRELVAKKFRVGRTFLAGDAAHAMSPTGGFGMNTGIGDAVDLGWKLAAALEGWGGDRLLDSYEQERRPVAERVVREATGNLGRMRSFGAHPELLDASREGALARYETARRYGATMLREWYKSGIDLGYRYRDSSITWDEDAQDASEANAVRPREPVSCGGLQGSLDDGTPLTPTTLREWHKLVVHLVDGYPIQTDRTELPADEVMVYRQSAAVGGRAPHVSLADGRSTLDLFGRTHVLLRLGGAAPSAEGLALAAARKAMPLEIVDLEEPDVFAAYGAPLVLVRPDGHVAWRGLRWPSAGVDALVDRVRGA